MARILKMIFSGLKFFDDLRNFPDKKDFDKTLFKSGSGSLLFSILLLSLLSLEFKIEIEFLKNISISH